MLDQLHVCCLLQEVELETEVSRMKYSEAKVTRATHSETLRDTAPVIEGIKVIARNKQWTRTKHNVGDFLCGFSL